MKCTFCGQDNNDTAKFCNNCGTPFTMNPSSEATSDNITASKPPETGNPDTGAPVVPEVTPTGNTLVTPTGNIAVAGTIPTTPVPVPNPVPRAIPVQPAAIRPSATGMIVFSVINILCCGSTVLGIIALVFALMATGEMDYNEAKNKLKISKILNIVGICITIVIFLIIIAIVIISIATGSYIDTTTGYESYNPNFY